MRNRLADPDCAGDVMHDAMLFRTCNRCGWVHFGVSRWFAEAEVQIFNSFYDNAAEETRRNFAGRTSVQDYEKCCKCGGPFTEFRAGGDCPLGVMLNPIIDPALEE